MPLSDPVRRAIKAAAAINPKRARRLLDLLRTAPEAVRRKSDRHGPLHLVLLGGRALLPEEAELCVTFGDEWRRGEIGIHELAAALEETLGELLGEAPDPGRYRPGGWRTMAGRERAPDGLIGPPM